MLKRPAISFALGVIAMLGASPACAEPLRLNAAVVCMPSAVQASGEVDRPGHFCLFRLPPLFAQTSVELTPRAAVTAQAVMKRLGADVELKF
jgi:hypothetical protein